MSSCHSVVPDCAGLYKLLLALFPSPGAFLSSFLVMQDYQLHNDYGENPVMGFYQCRWRHLWLIHCKIIYPLNGRYISSTHIWKEVFPFLVALYHKTKDSRLFGARDPAQGIFSTTASTWIQYHLTVQTSISSAFQPSSGLIKQDAYQQGSLLHLRRQRCCVTSIWVHSGIKLWHKTHYASFMNKNCPQSTAFNAKSKL